jgi:hypothetical protein
MDRISRGGVRLRSRIGGGGSRSDVLTVLLAVLVVTLVVGWRAPRITPAASPALSARTQLDQAATQMSAAITKGFSFTVISRSTLYAKTAGPKIQVPDPSDPAKVASLADTYYLGASAATGTVAGSDFFLQMYGGQTDAATAVDLGKMTPTLAALVTGGKTWRNDGVGWYPTDQPPGIGLDPRTVALLPSLLQRTSAAAAVAPTTLGGALLPTVTGTATVADAPGLMAIDAASFTTFAGPLTYAFDAQGRLAQLTVTMRNTKVADFDLLVVTTITFDYDHVGPIPAPAPTAPPPPTPAPDPVASPTPAASR